MNRSAARVAFVAGALVAAAIPSALIAFRPDPPPPPRALTPPARSVPPASLLDRPSVNYRGPIRGVDSSEGDHLAPTVTPALPLEIVTDDCTDLQLFDADTGADTENHTVSLYWWDPGVKENRSLTIYVDSPSCSRHPGARSLMRPSMG